VKTCQGEEKMAFTEDNKELVKQVFDLFAKHFGEDVELVLHDYSQDYEHSIVDIRNGHITGRQIGDTGDILGLEVLRGTVADGNSYNLTNYTDDDRILRSSTQFIKDKEGKVVACIAINQDVTKSVELERYLHRQNRTEENAHDGSVYRGDVNQMLAHLIEEAQYAIGKKPENMKREDKLAFIKYLDQRGAFLIAKSGANIAELLDISKYTFYSYLDAVRTGEQSATEE
jgi:predicted transcriptional regulator YheO